MRLVLLSGLCMLVVFWNVENLFADRPGFRTKCNAIAKTILSIADEREDLPDIIGLAEVQDRGVLLNLVYRTALVKCGYGIVHYDSPDKRGIDCALLYRKDRVRVLDSKPCHLYDSAGKVMATRDILLVRSDSICVLVNHHPSKLGGGGSHRRAAAMGRMNFLCDSLQAVGCGRILCIGDFNDDVWGYDSLAAKAGNLPPGTIKYNGHWEKIDGHFARGLEVEEEIFARPFLTQRDKTYGGEKPFRSYQGPRYTGGVSDHYPIVLDVKVSISDEKWQNSGR